MGTTDAGDEMRDFLKSRWWLLAMVFVYDISPIDVIPDAVPMLGLVDDLGVTGLAMLTAWAWYRKRREGQLLTADELPA
jgi:uncharacterized membrane protein YkvA (DUF1232 family)